MEESFLDQFFSKYKYPLLLCLVGGVVMVGGYFSHNVSIQPPKKNTSFPKEALVKADSLLIKVDISGQVQKPGVYELQKDARIEEALQAAGGVTDQADKTFVTKSLNLAQKVSDGMKLYIPSEGEPSSQPTILGTSASSSQNSALNINSADVGQLDSLPSIGQITAQKIIENRPYGSSEELLSKKIVSKSVYEKIKDQITAN